MNPAVPGPTDRMTRVSFEAEWIVERRIVLACSSKELKVNGLGSKILSSPLLLLQLWFAPPVVNLDL